MLVNEIIPFTQNYTFKIKIIKTTSKYIMVGVVDITKQKAATNSYGSSNAVAYYFTNGYKYPNMGVEGAGAAQG
jgi:ABC-type amino acid transport system permease subunit